jgi:molecular chaperone DnaK (HSP70)
MPARFAVGIDLGTTNTVVAEAALAGNGLAEVFPIPQLVAPSEVAARHLLPSALYAAPASESLADPFGDAPWTLGEFARRRGAEVPGRLVASSKSWLVHTGVDRTAPILPWGAVDDLPKISPVDAAARLLAHVARAWDAAHEGAKLADQDVVLTVPASFDEVARELSIEAARSAGLSPKLLEEPQAAFYDWMGRQGRTASRLCPSLVVVVDIGGGTTDLSLLRISGPESVARVAVGPHLLLGGDNMDLALAYACEPRLEPGGGTLDASLFAALVVACRAAKELLLGARPPDDAPVTLHARGSALVGAARTTRLLRDEVERSTLDGFLPRVNADARPQRGGSALVAFGLPYQRDVAITRHLAAFLARHLPPGTFPDAVLFNGGVFRAARIAERVLDVLSSWRGAPVMRLPDADPDLAVARGAVAYALARRGRGLTIGGGSAQSYFVGVDTAGEDGRPQAVCVVPRGAEEGAVHVATGRTFALALGQPARFELFASDSVDAKAGEVVDVDDDRFARLPSIATTLEPSAARPRAADMTELMVVLEGELTPVGTVDLACVEANADPARRFRLAFARRGEPLSAAIRTAPSRRPLDPALLFLDRAFGKPRADAGAREAKDLLRELERVLGDRARWTAEQNRALFDALIPAARARRRSPDHERVFWLLAGWCVRPGFGDPSDPARIAALTPLFDERLAFAGEARGWQQYFIAWRRAAGGLDEAMQTRIRDFVDPHVGPPDGGRRPKKVALSLEDALDMASSLERVAPSRRSALGGWVLERTWTDRDPRLWVAMGKLGARVPAYASVHHVVVPGVAERWLDHLLREKWDAVPSAAAAAVALARKTGDRARDVGERVRREVLDRLGTLGAPEDQLRAVRDVVVASEGERAAFFGDALPLGLRLVT